MKIAGSYESLIRGVSQQAPEVRLAGQHTEQVNMLSDPIGGLTRRRGTIHQHASMVPNEVDPASLEATGSGYASIRHSAEGLDYIILIRTRPQGGWVHGTSMPPIMCYNRTHKAFIDVVWNGAQQWETTLRQFGAASAASIGRYLLYATQEHKCTISNTTLYGPGSAMRKAVVWIRGGAYLRKYSVVVGNSTYSYQSPASTAEGSEAAIQPEYVAEQLALVLISNGYAGVQHKGSHLCFDLPANIADISVTDGGDGGLIRGCSQVLGSVDDLPLMAVHGQVVKIQPSADSWFYVKAVARAEANNVLQSVIWRECAGVEQGTTLSGLGVGRVFNNILYVGVMAAGDPTGLGHMPVGGGGNPTLVPSLAGDPVVNPPHRWMNNQITFLGMFQDRLLIGSGAALSVSAAGDYFNFFRTTQTTVPASDGFEVVAQGGEDDVLRHAVTYNRNLVIFGDRRQYVIPGTTSFTPVAPNMSVMTVYADAAECRPVAAGGQIYYARNREGWTGVHQIQPGQYVDSAESFPASSQVGSYIPAPTLEIEAVAGVPALLLLRSLSSPRSLYVFSYVDQPDGRKQDAWYRLEFHKRCGTLMSALSTPEGILLLWARAGQNGQVFRVADLLPLSLPDNDRPYLDSMRPASELGLREVGPVDPDWIAAYDKTTPRYLIGGPLATHLDKLAAAPEGSSLLVGIPFESYVIPTNQYARDKKGAALLNGRTTITKLTVNTKLSGGIAWSITAGNQTKEYEFAGRTIGSVFNTIGRIPVSSSLVSVPVGKETREYTVKFKARDWYPLTIAGIEYTGQSFNRTPRAEGG